MVSLSAHLQTMSSMVPTRRSKRPVVVEELVALPVPNGDGEIVVECMWQPHKAPAVIVMHGVAGNSRDPYVLRAADAFVEAGFHVVRLNQRGSGLGRKRARRIYHAALTEDLHVVEEMLAAREVVARTAVLGFSLGGHTALRYASEKRAVRLLGALVTISAPIDLPRTMRHLYESRTGLMGIYQALMVKSILASTRDLLELLGATSPVQIADLGRVRSLADVDQHLTLPLNGYTDVEQFHREASAYPHVGNIDVPTLVIHADDDPVVPSAQAREVHGTCPYVEALVTPTGGHIGFHESVWQLWGESFAITRAIEHFKRHLS